MATSVFLIALGTRLGYCAIAVFLLNKPAPGGPSHDGYVEIARSLASGQGYRLAGELNFFRPPTYVLFLVPWVSLPGWPYWILAVQCLIGALTCAWVARLILPLAGRRAAAFGGLAMALCPWHVHFSANGMTPVLAAFLVVALLAMSRDFGDAGSSGRSLFAGAVFGALALCHPSTVLLGPVWIAMRCLTGFLMSKYRAALTDGALFAMGALLLISPWIARNYRAGAGFIPLSNSAGFQAYVSDVMVAASPTLFSLPHEGIQPGLLQAQDFLRSRGVEPNPEVLSFKGVGIREGRVFDAWMKTTMLSDLRKFARRLFLQGWWFWLGDAPRTVPFHLLYKGPLILLAGVGLFRRWGSPTLIPLCGLSILCLWFVHAVFMGYIPHAAYSIVAMGPLCVLAGVGCGPRAQGAQDGRGAEASN